MIVLTTKGKLPNTSHFRFWPVATTKASALQHFPPCHGTIWPQACFDYLRLGCMSCTRGTQGGLFFYKPLFGTSDSGIVHLGEIKLLPNENDAFLASELQTTCSREAKSGQMLDSKLTACSKDVHWWSVDRTLRANVLWNQWVIFVYLYYGHAWFADKFWVELYEDTTWCYTVVQHGCTLSIRATCITAAREMSRYTGSWWAQSALGDFQSSTLRWV